jgi:hypothetical protein
VSYFLFYKDKKLVYFSLVLYVISSLPLVFNTGGVFWDDWVIYDQDPETLYLLFDMLSHGLKGYFAKFILGFNNSILIFRLSGLLLHLLMCIAFYWILNSVKTLSRELTEIAFCFTLLYPLPETRVAISIVPFIFPILFYFVAGFLVASRPKYYLTNNFGIAVIIILLLISFDTNSVLSYYFVLFFFIIYKYLELRGENLKFTVADGKILLFILPPFIYYGAKLTWFQPWGLYGGYNSLSLDGVYHLPFTLMKSLGVAFIKIFIYSEFILPAFLIFILTICISAWNTYTKNGFFSSLRVKIMALTMVIFSVLPYLVVGKYPEAGGWNSRFLLLVPFGVGLFWASCISGLDQKKLYQRIFKKFTISTILIFFTSVSLFSYNNFIIKWFVNDYLMQEFRESRVFSKNSTFLITEVISGVNATSWKNFYEWTGLISQVYPERDKLIIPNYGKINLASYCGNPYRQYNYANWRCNNNYHDINLSYDIKGLRFKTVILIYYYNFDRGSFDNEMRRWVHVNISEIQREWIDGSK